MPLCLCTGSHLLPERSEIPLGIISSFHRHFFLSVSSKYVMAVSLVVLVTAASRSECISSSFAFTMNSFPPTWLPCQVLVWGLSPCLIGSCFACFVCCLLEACSFWIGNWGEVEIGERGWEIGDLNKWRKGKLKIKDFVTLFSLFMYEKQLCLFSS